MGCYLYPFPDSEVYETEVVSWWDYARRNLLLVALQFFGGFTICVLFIFASEPFIDNPGLVAVAVLVVILALYRGGIAATEVRELQREGESWLLTFQRTSGAGVAISIFGLLLWIFVFLSTSAGLHFYGL